MPGSLHWGNCLALYRIVLSGIVLEFITVPSRIVLNWIVLEFRTVHYMPGSLPWRNSSALYTSHYRIVLDGKHQCSEPEQTWPKPTVHLVYTMGEGSVPEKKGLKQHKANMFMKTCLIIPSKRWGPGAHFTVLPWVSTVFHSWVIGKTKTNYINFTITDGKIQI